VAKQYSVTYNGYDNWVMPLNLAVGFHIVLALSIVFVPGLFKSKPKFEDIYTVNLINISEPSIEQEVAQPQQQPETTPPPQPKPVKAKKIAAIAEPVKVDPVPVPTKAVSIKPLKRKIKKKLKVVKPDVSQQKQLEKLKREKIAEAIQAEKIAAEQARIAAEEAARQQKLLEQQLAQIKSQGPSQVQRSSRSGSRSSGTLSVLEKQYYSSIINRVSQFWALPEFRPWDPSLQAIVIVTIAQDGTITNQFFEEGSQDPTFDQFVRKTLQNANPLPAIPPALKKKQYEIGLRFRPGSIQ